MKLRERAFFPVGLRCRLALFQDVLFHASSALYLREIQLNNEYNKFYNVTSFLHL